jgi:hypothetical protein
MLVDLEFLQVLSGEELLVLADNETVYFQSEETGYSHLYIQFKVKLKTQLTQGNWEVRSVALAKDRKAFY